MSSYTGLLIYAKTKYKYGNGKSFLEGDHPQVEFHLNSPPVSSRFVDWDNRVEAD